jgi:ABC-type transporter Mla MlaB component
VIACFRVLNIGFDDSHGSDEHRYDVQVHGLGLGLMLCFETMTPDLWLRASGRYERFRPMLLRITPQHEGALTVIAIDGHLVRDGVAELERLCQGVTAPLALDLTYLQRVDAEGIALLNTLADAGAQLRGASPYIALLLGRSRR